MPVVWRSRGFLNHKRACFIQKSNNVQHFCEPNPVWNFENFHKKPWGQLIITETTFLRFLNQHGVTESLQGQRGLGDALGEEFLCTECLCNELLLGTGKPRVLSSHEQPQLTLKTLNLSFPCLCLGCGFLKSLEHTCRTCWL